MFIDPKWVRAGALMSGAVLTKAFLIFCGYWLGSWIDQRFGTRSIFMILGVTGGISLGLWWIIYVANRVRL